MARNSLSKKERHKRLLDKLAITPFMTDDELGELFCVSVQTIRLDRLELGIPELRERIKDIAEINYKKLKSIEAKEVIGELIDIELGKSGISINTANSDMQFEKSKVTRGHFIYAQAESLAIAVIDAKAALTGVANIKYMQPVNVDDKLLAKAEVIRQRGNKYFVWVTIWVKKQQVFRGKFILVSLDEKFEGGNEVENNN